MVKQQLLIGAALLVGAAIGFAVKTDAPTRPAEEPAPTHESAAKSPIADAGAAASMAALRARVKELEAQLAAGRPSAIPPPPQTNTVAEADGEPRPPRDRRGGMREMMEEMRKNDPERFAQMTNRFAEMRRNRQERQRARADFLSSVNPALLSEDRRKTHVAYQNLLERRESLFEKMGDMELSEEERHELWRELRSVGDEMRQLASAERDTLLNAVAEAVGLEGDAATELVETVKDVCDATDASNDHHRGRPPRMDRGR